MTAPSKIVQVGRLGPRPGARQVSHVLERRGVKLIAEKGNEELGFGHKNRYLLSLRRSEATEAISKLSDNHSDDNFSLNRRLLLRLGSPRDDISVR